MHLRTRPRRQAAAAPQHPPTADEIELFNQFNKFRRLWVASGQRSEVGDEGEVEEEEDGNAEEEDQHPPPPPQQGEKAPRATLPSRAPPTSGGTTTASASGSGTAHRRLKHKTTTTKGTLAVRRSPHDQAIFKTRPRSVEEHDDKWGEDEDEDEGEDEDEDEDGRQQHGSGGEEEEEKASSGEKELQSVTMELEELAATDDDEEEEEDDMAPSFTRDTSIDLPTIEDNRHATRGSYKPSSILSYDLGKQDMQDHFAHKLQELRELLGHVDAAMAQLGGPGNLPPLALRTKHLAPFIGVLSGSLGDLAARIYPSVTPLAQLLAKESMSPGKAPELHAYLDHCCRIVAACPSESHKAPLQHSTLFSRCVQNRTGQTTHSHLKAMMVKVHAYQHRYSPQMYGPFPRAEVLPAMFDAIAQYTTTARSPGGEATRVLKLHDHLLAVARLGPAKGASDYDLCTPSTFNGPTYIGNAGGRYYLLARGYRNLAWAAGLVTRKARPTQPTKEAGTDIQAYREATAFLLWAHGLPYAGVGGLAPTVCLQLFVFAGVGGLLKDLNPRDLATLEALLATDVPQPQTAGRGARKRPRLHAGTAHGGDAESGSNARPMSSLRDPQATSTLVYGEFPAACGPTYVSQVEVTRLHDDVYIHGQTYHSGRAPRIIALSSFVVGGLPFRTAVAQVPGKM